MDRENSQRPLGDKVRNYVNPIVFEDLPDMEVIRVGDIFYMSASSFHFSPGAPILRSFDLVTWEYIGHSVPDIAEVCSHLSFDDLSTVGYIKGIWASTLRYRESNKLFYWYGAIQGTNQTHVYTADEPSGPWVSHPPLEKFYYDAGLLIDQDDPLFISYGTKKIFVAQLSADGLEEVTSRQVYESDEYLEGARMYNINGTYYIWLTKPSGGQYVLKSRVGPFGPYDCRMVLDNMRAPVAGGAAPHQGALVETAAGAWYYIAFMDAFPAGRVPVLAPVKFDDDGWPEIIADYQDAQGQWRLQYPLPLAIDGHHDVQPNACFRRHCFKQAKLDPCWQWNHSPDSSKWSVQQDRLLLQTGRVVDNLYLATNTLTHRVIGPKSTATFLVVSSNLKNGDRAGVCLLRDKSAYIGIHKSIDGASLVYVDDICLELAGAPIRWSDGRPVANDWHVSSKGTIRSETRLARERVLLRIDADVAPACADGYEQEPRRAKFEFSYDGTTFEQLGPLFTMTNAPTGWVGYRFGLFNFATEAPGGHLAVEHCDIEQ